MVVAHNFQDVFDASAKITDLKLPLHKENGLKVSFKSKLKNEETITAYKGSEPLLPFAVSQIFYSSIVNKRRLTATHDDCKAIYEITLDVEGSNFTFKAGDTIGIIAKNRQKEVEFIINHLQLSSYADLPCEVNVDTSQKGAKLPSHVPIVSSIRHILTNCLDIRSTVKKLLLLALAKHTKDENERRVLEYLCSAQGSVMYNSHVLNKNLCILDLFRIFPSCKPPVEVLLANLPRLLPRPYSIANSGCKDPTKIKICFSVMNIGNNRKGLTTGWLEGIINKKETIEDVLENLDINSHGSGIKVPIYIRKNMANFYLPQNLEDPLILIGPGTGVSPFIGFLEEIEHLKAKDPDRKVGCVWLFYGCRNPKLDFIYEQEISNFICNKTINQFSTSFSRMGNDKMKYVQDAIRTNGAAIVDLIEKGAFIFLCGDVKTIASQVKQALVEIMVTHSKKNIEESEKTLTELEKHKRFIIDTWN